jgi:thiol-disulfide isomerase/thioredoxin
MKMRTNIALAIALIAIIGATLYLESFRPNMVSSEEAAAVKNVAKPGKAALYPVAKEIVDPTGFINTDKITISELIGKKVILIDFWTYLCINCQHTLPYLKSWYAKYKDQGFVIIGIHTPELPPERDPDNVRAAVKNYGIEYPVVLDNNYATWNAYNNRYWPALYLIDIDGYIVYTHFGEGAYTETEHTIQGLLRERAATLGTASTTTGITSQSFQAIELDYRNRYAANAAYTAAGLLAR